MKTIKIDNFLGEKTTVFEGLIAPKKGIASYEVDDACLDRLVQICQRFQISYIIEQPKVEDVEEPQGEPKVEEKKKKAPADKKNKQKDIPEDPKVEDVEEQ